MNLVKLLRGAHLPYIAYNPGFARHTGSLEAGVLLAHLLNLWGLHGDGFYSKKERIIYESGMSLRQWRRGIATLQEQGLVRVEKRGLPARNYYYIDAGKVGAMLEEIADSALESDSTSQNDGVTTSQCDGVPTGQNDGVPTYKKQLEEAVEEKTPKPPRIAKPSWAVPESVSQEVWAEFEAHRVEVRKPLTDRARAKNCDVLLNLTHDEQREVVDRTIANRWTGLFPPDKKRNGKATGLDADGLQPGIREWLNEQEVIDGECVRAD